MKRVIVISLSLLMIGPVLLSAQESQRKPATLTASEIFLAEGDQDQNAGLPLTPHDASGNRDLNYPIDQIQPLAGAYMAQFYQTDLAQSFVPSADKICGAGIGIYNFYNNTGDVTIMLYDNLPNAGGNLLASGTTGFSFGEGISLIWADVSWPEVSITPGNTYFLVFTCTNPQPMVAGNVENPYPYGMVYANPGYFPFPSFDYTFRTYTCTGMSNTIPLSNWAIYLAIALMGLAVIWVVIRRR